MAGFTTHTRHAHVQASYNYEGAAAHFLSASLKNAGDRIPEAKVLEAYAERRAMADQFMGNTEQGVIGRLASAKDNDKVRLILEEARIESRALGSRTATAITHAYLDRFAEALAEKDPSFKPLITYKR